MRRPQHTILIRYLLAAGLCRSAEEGAKVVLVLLAIDQTGSTAFGGLLAACFLVPHVLAAPASGAFADRSRHRARFQAVALACFGLCLITIGGMAGTVPDTTLLAIALVGGCFGPFVTGGMSSLVGRLAGEGSRERAFSLDLMTYNGAGVIGPAVGVLIAGLASPAVATIALGVLALAGGALAASFPLDRPQGEPGVLTVATLLSLDTFRLVWRNVDLRNATFTGSLGLMGYAATPLGAVVLAAERQAGYLTGMCVAASAIGGVMGSLLYTRWPIGAFRPIRTMILGLVAVAIPAFLVTVGGHPMLIVLFFALIGLPSGPIGSSVFLVWDRESPEHLQTQVFTVGAGIRISSGAIGTYLAGVLATLGSGAVFAGIGLVSLAAALLGTVLARRVREPVGCPALSGPVSEP